MLLDLRFSFLSGKSVINLHRDREAGFLVLLTAGEAPNFFVPAGDVDDAAD